MHRQRKTALGGARAVSALAISGAAASAVARAHTPGALAAVLTFLLVRARLLPDFPRHEAGRRRWTPLLVVPLVGVSAAVVWELYAWVLEQLVRASVMAGYTDTIADLAAGMAGSVVAGRLVLLRRRHSGKEAKVA